MGKTQKFTLSEVKKNYLTERNFLGAIMNLYKSMIVGMALLALTACNSRYSSPILVERGVEQYEREYFATKESMGIEKRLKDIFLQGYIEEGMTQEMVNLLWGPPDHELQNGYVWEYFTRDGKLITRLKWKDPEVARMKGYESELVLDKIEGDRYGGSKPPQKSLESAY